MSVPSPSHARPHARPHVLSFGRAAATAREGVEPATGASVIAEFATHAAAEVALLGLVRAGFATPAFSIIGQGCHVADRAIGLVTGADRLRRWTGLGAAWGAFTGLLYGAVADAPLAERFFDVSGPVAALLLPAFLGAMLAAGFGALAAFVLSTLAPGRVTVKYRSNLRAETFILVMHAADADIVRARTRLREDMARPAASTSL